MVKPAYGIQTSHSPQQLCNRGHKHAGIILQLAEIWICIVSKESNIEKIFWRGISELVERKNKRPKGPHIVHMSTIWHLFKESARAANFVYWSAWKIKLGRGRWDLASCQVSLNSFQRFQGRSWKCLSQSEATAAILFFWLARKTQTW